MTISAFEFVLLVASTGVVSGTVGGVLFGAADEIESIPLGISALVGSVSLILVSHFIVNWPSLLSVYHQTGRRGVVVLSLFLAFVSFVGSLSAGYLIERATIQRGGIQSALSYCQCTTRRVCARTASDFRTAWNATIYGEDEETS